MVPERCTRSYAAIVDRKPRFRSSQPRAVQSTVRNASRSTGHHVGTSYLVNVAGFPFDGAPVKSFFVINIQGFIVAYLFTH